MQKSGIFDKISVFIGRLFHEVVCATSVDEFIALIT